MGYALQGQQEAAPNSGGLEAIVNMASPFGNPEAASLRDDLTERETEVLKLMAEGLTTKQIATSLGIAFKTAACHRYRILEKLGVKTTVCAIRLAFRIGLVEL
jgi:DNA-binding NarL/FixJ family response regulator